jgi:hypothetical protein
VSVRYDFWGAPDNDTEGMKKSKMESKNATCQKFNFHDIRGLFSKNHVNEKAVVPLTMRIKIFSNKNSASLG